jgi:DNA primase
MTMKPHTQARRKPHLTAGMPKRRAACRNTKDAGRASKGTMFLDVMQAVAGIVQVGMMLIHSRRYRK